MATIKKAKMPAPIQSAGNPNDMPSTTQASSFFITIKSDNHAFSGVGETALDALRSVRPPSLDLIGSGSLTIVHGDKSKEMYFSGIQLKRILNPDNQQVLIQELAQGL